jgi:hypothetical protein
MPWYLPWPHRRSKQPRCYFWCKPFTMKTSSCAMLGFFGFACTARAYAMRARSVRLYEYACDDNTCGRSAVVDGISSMDRLSTISLSASN